MDIQAFQLLGRLAAPQVAQRAKQAQTKAQTQNQSQYAGQALPQFASQPRGKQKGLSPTRLLSDLEPEEMQALGGGSSLETMAQAQPSLTVGEVTPLLRNRTALDAIAQLMEERQDVKISDFMSTDKKGRVRLDPSYKDPEVMEFLKERPDIPPREVTAMRQNFTKKFKNPFMGQRATKKALKLLAKRTDMSCDDATDLMNKVAQAAGVGQKGAKGSDPQAAPQAALDMFDSASKVLQKRDDLKPHEVGKLATSVGALGSPKDKQRAGRVAEGFDAATKSLEANPQRRPAELGELATTIGEHFKGSDEKTAGFRMNAFKQSSQLMGENPAMDAKSVGNFLREAKQRDPKIKNAPPAKKAQLLAGAMDNLNSGLKSGKVSANNLNQHFENKKTEENRGKLNKNQNKNRQGLTDGENQGKTKEGSKSQGSTSGIDGSQKAKSINGSKTEAQGANAPNSQNFAKKPSAPSTNEPGPTAAKPEASTSPKTESGALSASLDQDKQKNEARSRGITPPKPGRQDGKGQRRGLSPIGLGAQSGTTQLGQAAQGQNGQVAVG